MPISRGTHIDISYDEVKHKYMIKKFYDKINKKNISEAADSSQKTTNKDSRHEEYYAL
jgi:hypothetical protein